MEQVERVETMKMDKNLLTSSKYAGLCEPSSGAQGPAGPLQGLGAAMGPVGPGLLHDLLAAELMIGFWFGIGVILAVKTVQSLEYCIEELISRK